MCNILGNIWTIYTDSTKVIEFMSDDEYPYIEYYKWQRSFNYLWK